MTDTIRLGSYDKLNEEILPKYYDEPEAWDEIVSSSVIDVVPFFDSGRMAEEYYESMCKWNESRFFYCQISDNVKAVRVISIEVAGNYKAKWGEGPIWWDGVLYYVDIEGQRVCRYYPETGEEKCWDIGQRVGTVVPRSNGGLVIAGDDGFFFLNEQTGGLSPIDDPEPDKPNNRFNDGKCSPDGRFFAGTISLVKKQGDAKLYRLDPDLSVHEAFSPVTNSNGIVWSEDGKTVYYIDTPRKEVLAFDYVDADLVNLRSVVSTAHHEASPDGMTIDDGGNLWIAFCHGACVACFDPRTGQEIRKIDLPCLETTACAFGGPGLTDLYVTTGIHKTEVEEYAGRLFRIRGLGVKGISSHAFAG